MGQYRKRTTAKGLHVRMDADLLTWVDEEAERRCLSRAALMEMAVKQLRTRLTAIELEKTDGDGD